VRARRRLAELSEKGLDVTFEEVLADVEARDARDMGRADAPLRPAADAVEIDTTEMSIEDAIAAAVAVIEARRGPA
jgi:cytidylate kinase